ncbi:MAG: carbonic anhydrase [Bdellovibrionota bacterium]
MRKLLEGIIEFRRNVQKDYREAFGRLAIGQSPDTLFIACSDSRVVPNTFASTNPGDLFVLRNVGNIVPPCGKHGMSVSDESEPAAVEYAIETLNVADIVVCGHSECGAMRALIGNRYALTMPNLKSWLRHADEALERLKGGGSLDPAWADYNQLSQLNVLLQIEHIKSYPSVQKKIDEGKLNVHGWFFDIAKAEVYVFEPEDKRFVLIDEEEVERMLARHPK